MKCISSPALDDFQIMSYVEGEADDEVVAHMKQCRFCREKASRWGLLQNRLREQSYRSNCPTPIELGDYHFGLLPAPQVLVVAQHLRECPLCRHEVAELKNFLVDLAPETGLAENVKVLIARFVNPMADSRPATALRGEARGPLTFEAEGVVLNLDVQPGPGGQVSLVGQVAAEEQDQWTGAQIELQQADALELTASLDDLGAFQFEKVSPGKIQITIKSLYGIEVQIPSIDLTV